jgi:hypothetical protein
VIAMNVVETEVDPEIIAKTCNCLEKDRKVTYLFLNSYHSLCKDKRDILSNELVACERLLKYSKDPIDKEIIEREIADLRLILDRIQ